MRDGQFLSIQKFDSACTFFPTAVSAPPEPRKIGTSTEFCARFCRNLLNRKSFDIAPFFAKTEYVIKIAHLGMDGRAATRRRTQVSDGTGAYT